MVRTIRFSCQDHAFSEFTNSVPVGSTTMASWAVGAFPQSRLRLTLVLAWAKTYNPSMLFVPLMNAGPEVACRIEEEIL